MFQLRFVSVFVVSFAFVLVGTLTAQVQSDVKRAIIPLAPAAVIAGGETFRQYCAPCHGPTAQGNGPVAAMLITQPADLTQIARRNSGTFPLEEVEALLVFGARSRKLAHGTEQMPIWGPTFTATEGSPALARVRFAALLAYLESIQE